MMYPIQIANEIRTSINGCITQHHKKSKLQITEETPDPVSGICWQWLCKLAIKGDTKGRGKQLAILQAEKQNKKNKVDSRKMIEQYGKLDVVFNTQKKTNEL